jgi:glucosamine-phosphate N-acetyltransferase
MEYKDFRGQRHIIGHGTLVVEKKLIHNISKVGHIEDVVIHKDCRGLNMGKKMIEHLMKVAEERGCYKVILDCDMKNVEFYVKCGLKPKGIEMARYF